MLKKIRDRLDAKISLRLIAIAIPLLALAVWWAAAGERAAVGDLILDKGRTAALAGAQAYASILESGIDAGAISLQDLIEPTYEEIRFPEIEAKGRKVEDRRYHTRYDGYTDAHGIQQVEDAILAASPDFIYASGMDLRGYVATPHKKYGQPPNGDPVHDRAFSRAKRKYDQPLHLSAAGYVGNEPTLVQDYLRDTGEPIWDVAAPIWVKGKHFGAFRVGVLKSQAGVRAAELTIGLSRSLGAAVLLIAAAIFLTLRRSMRPLVNLAVTATLLSTSHNGKELEKPIRASSTDEVGRMALSLERLRRSLLKVWAQI